MIAVREQARAGGCLLAKDVKSDFKSLRSGWNHYRSANQELGNEDVLEFFKTNGLRTCAPSAACWQHRSLPYKQDPEMAASDAILTSSLNCSKSSALSMADQRTEFARKLNLHSLRLQRIKARLVSDRLQIAGLYHTEDIELCLDHRAALRTISMLHPRPALEKKLFDSRFWPSQTESSAAYRSCLQLSPIMFINRRINFSSAEFLPSLSQNAKDVVRDSFCINNQFIPGIRGYQQILNMVADCLVRSGFNDLEIKAPWIGDNLHVTASQNTTNTSTSETAAGSTPPPVKSNPELDVSKWNRSHFVAAALLNLLGRTCSGGMIYDEVRRVFDRHPFESCIADPKSIFPLELSIVDSDSFHDAENLNSSRANGVQTGSGDSKQRGPVAFLSSKLRYALREASSGSVDKIGEVDCTFAATLRVQDVFTGAFVNHLRSFLTSTSQDPSRNLTDSPTHPELDVSIFMNSRICTGADTELADCIPSDTGNAGTTPLVRGLKN